MLKTVHPDLGEGNCLLCPTCRSETCRRSRRRGFQDHLYSVFGLRPWRCRTCEKRFYAGVVPARWSFYVYCPSCGNMDLQTVARDRVMEGWFRGFYRLLRVPAYRCEACRTRFFSARRFRRIKPNPEAPPVVTPPA